ncbi:hypothetical protein MYAER_0993 [Microcystis aeruginosa NIES-2549]|uniref:Uncharacterized protein n=1 Tax=Microcystis aeruginosa NIES-2549 TaxID=1641812 RepID=A0A0F6U2G5_MICAE|nr:hypothetical protein MYAER_0993 [Microcystis aeruginosa NIES-2549]AOC51742.1 hypothetical protein amyaer_1003 [Microcystis aeruginosa NIES-2481]
MINLVSVRINVADLPSRKLEICAKLLRGLFSEAALRR